MIAAPDILDVLRPLVAMDTRNGTGDEVACADWLADRLNAHAPDELTVERVVRTGKSDSAYVLAIWGEPKTLFNVHIDTVPTGAGWTGDALTLRERDDRVVGLGTSDIKGAVACILAAMGKVQPRNCAVLFSGDEEHGSEVMADFVTTEHMDRFRTAGTRAIVCEPTDLRIGRRHRGMLAFGLTTTGRGGHSSLADITKAPLLDLARIASDIGDYGDARRDHGPDGYKGVCVNIGTLSGGAAYNVIPTQAHMKLSLRPPPGDDVPAHRDAICDIIGDRAAHETLVCFPPFESRNANAFADLEAGSPVDLPYWTEASMLGDAGLNAVVYGPGEVGQAHMPDESVKVADLRKAATTFARLLA